MTKDEIKATTTVPEILQKYGIEVKRGRCKGFCHNGKHLNAQVSRDLYYCHVCNDGMDIFDLTMYFNNCDFQTALELLGGSEKPSFTALRKAKTAKRNREVRLAKESRFKAEMGRIQRLITAYRNIIAKEEPFSDLWCYCQNKLQYQLYLYEEKCNLKVR